MRSLLPGAPGKAGMAVGGDRLVTLEDVTPTQSNQRTERRPPWEPMGGAEHGAAHGAAFRRVCLAVASCLEGPGAMPLGAGDTLAQDS